MNKIDRISDLPDQILQHIISFLSTKEAARTSVLAKRWVDLWASLPSLVLDSKGNESNFEKFVNRIFRIRESMHLDSFKISCKPNPEMLKKWLHNVVKLQPRSLSVTSSVLPLALPGSVFRCESIEELELSVPYPGIEPIPVLRPRLLNLSRLKRLEIYGEVRLDDEFMGKLMSSCVLLEELCLCRHKLEMSMISSNVPKSLVISCGCDHCEKIIICTPNLLYLELYGAPDGFTFEEMYFLDTAKIKFGGFVDKHTYLWCSIDDTEVLNALSNVRHLELHGDAVLALLQKALLNFPIFENLTTLHCWTDDTFYPIGGFLECTPNLEKLTLYYTECMTSSGRCDDHYDSRPFTPSFVCPHLKEIEIRGTNKYEAAKLVQEILASNKIPQTKINFA